VILVSRVYGSFLQKTAIPFLLLLAGNVCAQKLQFDQYDIRQGLPSSVVVDIMQDRKGYMWFATIVGVSRYDGYTFKNYGIQDGFPCNETMCITEDSLGRVWVGTNGGGLALFNKGRWSFRNTDDGLADNTVRSIFEDADHAIWCYSENGLSRVEEDTIYSFAFDNWITCYWAKDASKIYVGTYNGLHVIEKENHLWHSVKCILPEVIVSCLLKDTHGYLWIGTWGNGIYRFDGKTFIHYSGPQGLPQKPVLCLLEDSQGNLLAGFMDAGIIRFENDRFVANPSPELHNATILSMTSDNRNRIWARSRKEGIFVLEGNQVRNISTRNNLPDINVYKIMVDSDGDIWIGTGGGVSKLGKKPFEIYDVESGIPGKDVLCTYVDKDGNVWGGCYSGPFRISPEGRVRTFTEKDGLNQNYLTINKITSDFENNLWFGTYLGITEFSDDHFHTYPNPVWARDQHTSYAIYDIAINRQNKLVLAGDDGICEFYKGIYFFSEHYKTLADHDIRAIEFDESDNLWICTSEGIHILGKNNITITSSEGLSNNSCNDVFPDSSGIAWIATDNGLNKISLRSDGSYSISSLTTQDGLLSNSIMFVEGDRKGDLWIGHEKGLSRLTKASGKIITYTAADGFTPMDTYVKAVSVDDSNNIWIGTVAGLVKYNPRLDQPQPNPPRMYITGIKFYLDSTDIYSFSGSTDSLTGLPGNLVLPYNRNNLIFEYAGLHYANTDKNRYRYILEGYDDKWSEPHNQTETHPYQKIPHGEYTFKVMASNCDGVWSEPVAFSFSVKPPFWQTGWFYALEVMLGLGFIYAFVRIRVRKLQHDKKVLAQKVKERTLEIERQRDHIAEINKEITDSIQYAQHIQSAVLPDEDIISSRLNDYFILFKPRDIVSGDFYWVSTKGKKTIVVAADCTGHGVPGAFMSMLGISLLNEIVTSGDGLTAADILNQLREDIKRTLSQTGKSDEAKDGMDMSLCIIDTEDFMTQFAGAYNPLCLVSNDVMIVYKGDKMPIGIHFTREYHFTNHVFQLKDGDVFYMFSDGYADQFGGPERKKFKSCNLRDLLLTIHKKPMPEQKAILDKTIEDWKGNEAQVDDIMVMGVRINTAWFKEKKS
jgi:ligand-binding sensor domain-containing protein/serine phosphatase RsbU (regulator of sigma subunit)